MTLKTVTTVRSKVNQFLALLFFDFVFWLLVLKPAIQLKKR